MSSKRATSLKDTKKCAIFNRLESNENNSIRSPTFSCLVLLAMNLKKSPWLLSRCKNTFNHVQLAQTLLKDSDSFKVIVKLMRTPWIGFNDERYLVLISSFSDENEEMNLLLGINVVNQKVTVGLMLPITMDTDICLDGDGGFFVSNKERRYSFQPVSIQEMWSALQALVKCVFSARSRKSQQVLSDHYKQLPKSEAHQVFEWERVNDALSSKTNEIVSCESKESCQLKVSIRRKLQEILVNVDLDTVTSREIRDRLEDKLKMNIQQSLGLSLSQYKQFIDEETILAMRQMDSPSQILDFLYLGSEWNASNFEELKRNRIGYVLNVTKEIENFFPGMFKYCNVQVYDYEETELLKHWNNTFKFISEAM